MTETQDKMTEQDAQAAAERQAKLDKVLARVQQLIAMASHEIAPGATPEERAATLVEQQRQRDMADSLMLQYAIDEAMLDMSRPAAARQKAAIREFVIGSNDFLVGYFNRLADLVARHARCNIRSYTRWDREAGGWIGKVYGFDSELRYFDMLYTTLRLHMLGVLLPKVDPAESLDDNCYRLHGSGYNWLEIAVMYGWQRVSWNRNNEGLSYTKVQEIQERYPAWQDVKNAYWNEGEGQLSPATTVGGIYKRAYLRAVTARNERPTQIPAGGAETFKRSAADGYVNRITRRIRDTEQNRTVDMTSAALVLASQADDIDSLFRQDNPDLYEERPAAEPCPKCEANPSGYCRDHPRGRTWKPAPTSAKGYAAGTRHADTADLRPKAGEARRPALG